VLQRHRTAGGLGKDRQCISSRGFPRNETPGAKRGMTYSRNIEDMRMLSVVCPLSQATVLWLMRLLVRPCHRNGNVEIGPGRNVMGRAPWGCNVVAFEVTGLNPKACNANEVDSLSPASSMASRSVYSASLAYSYLIGLPIFS
jgi:hypothetical protein